MSWQEAAYGPVFARLLRTDRNRALDAGAPDPAHYSLLAALDVDQAFAHARLVDRQSARCCLAALWLLYDFLDESHTISQEIATPEGSFWHAVMHRREGDFSNAKYWLRQVGDHRASAQLASDWDACAFVDACQQALQTGGPSERRCRELQQQEWEQWFDHCFRQALGG